MPSPLRVSRRDCHWPQDGKVLTCSTKSIAVDFDHAKSQRVLSRSLCFGNFDDFSVVVHLAFATLQVASALPALSPGLRPSTTFTNHEQKTGSRTRDVGQ